VILKIIPRLSKIGVDGVRRIIATSDIMTAIFTRVGPGNTQEQVLVDAFTELATYGMREIRSLPLIH
jgi:hypothetical protein